MASAAQSVDRLVEAGAGDALIIARRGCRPLRAVVIERQPEMSAAQGQHVKSESEQESFPERAHTNVWLARSRAAAWALLASSRSQ